MEIFNECTIIMVTYGLITFTEYVPEPETRYRIGWYYIGTALGNVLVHLSFLTYDTGKITINKCRNKYFKTTVKAKP